MNILIATGIFPPDIGGPATYSKILDDELPKQCFGVEVLSFGRVRHLPKLIRHIVYFFLVLSKGMRADIIFAQDPVSVGLPALCAAKLLRKRFILKIVGDYAWEQWQQESRITNHESRFLSLEEFQTGKFGLITELRRSIQRYVARKADVVIVPSAYLKTIIMRWGVANANARVVYNAFSPVHIPESKEILRQKLGLSGIVIFSAGRLVPWKGFALLIDSIPEILKHIPDTVLMIAGDGPQRHMLESKIKKLGLSGIITLTGTLRHDHLLHLLKASDLFVLNTGYEGFSHQILEAMAIGTPVITTHVGGNGEIITSGENGVLIPYNDEGTLANAIVKIARNPDIARQYAKKAQETAQLFSEERMIRETIAVLANRPADQLFPSRDFQISSETKQKL